MSKDHELINKLKIFFATRQEVLFAWLFGSVATGKANRFSDVDIAIYVSDQKLLDDFEWYLELKSKLMEALFGRFYE